MKNLERILTGPDASISNVMKIIQDGHIGIALVVDQERILINTVTDGDIRRAILNGVDLGLPVTILKQKRSQTFSLSPVIARVGTSHADLLHLMSEQSLRHIPLVDEAGRVVDIAFLDDLVGQYELPLTAVLMAGGYGTRLKPLTDILPKPMLPVGGKPLMERVIEQLRQAGIRRMNLTTHFKPEKIIEYFGDGSAFGVELNYVNEEQPLGTGGALGLMPAPSQPLLVINGDILTQVNFRAMFEFHQEQKADLTMAVRRYEMQVPYGVIECEGALVRRLQEKPQVDFLVNAGIYLLEPSVYQFIPQNTSFNMTDLIQWLLDARRTVISFPVHEYWLDIGQHADYTQAQGDVNNGRFSE